MSIASKPILEYAHLISIKSPRSIRYLGLVVLLLATAMLLVMISSGGGFERPLQNIRDTINSKPASGRIHIVEIDAKSLSTLDRWPWPRRNHAALIDQLNEVGVEQIVFDVDFSSYSTATDDAALATAISRAAGKVVLPTFRQAASNDSHDDEVENLPIAMLRNQVFLGSVNVRPDRSGQVNSYSYGTVTAATPRPSIGALLADSSGPVHQEFSIDHSIDISTIPRHSFVDIIQGRFDRANLKGKKVIIGATAIEIGDRYATARFGVVPGVVIQALAAETLIAGNAVPDYGPWPMLLLALLGLIVGFKIPSRNRSTRLTAATLLAVAVFSIPVLTERYRVLDIENAPALLLLFCSYVGRFIIGMMQKIGRERKFDRETGLPNLVSWQRQPTRRELATVVCAEIANFGEILSTLGEADSKKFILAAVDRIQLSSGRGNLYRMGRKQFCWLSEAQTSSELDVLLESTAHLFNAPLLIDGRSIRAKLCFGVARGELSNPTGLSNNAALAAKRASEIGVRSMWHDDGLAHDTDQSLFILSEFEEALITGQISVVYQPKYSLAEERVTGAEALVRWMHPEKGSIGPAIFVPILERENLMEALTLFVLRQVVDDIRAWNFGGGHIGCAINISASLLLNAAFADRAIAILRSSGVDPKLLTFELTETAVLSSVEHAVSTLNRFKELGSRLSIDDYGTGQSTLSYLKSFSADEIKIDQSFVKLVASDTANRIMVRSSIEMAHALGMSVVAEGVEGNAAMQVLREFGCDVIQGWHIGRAVTKAEFVQRWCQFDDELGEKMPAVRKLAS